MANRVVYKEISSGGSGACEPALWVIDWLNKYVSAPAVCQAGARCWDYNCKHDRQGPCPP